MRVFLFGGLALLALGATGAAVGCTINSTTTSIPGGGLSDASTTDGSSTGKSDAATTADGGDGGTCDKTLNITYEPAACNTCMQANCLTVSKACTNDCECQAYLNCTDECADSDGGADACVLACANAHPSGATLYDPVDSCYATKCMGDPDAGDAGAGPCL